MKRIYLTFLIKKRNLIRLVLQEYANLLLFQMETAKSKRQFDHFFNRALFVELIAYCNYNYSLRVE